MLDVNVFRHSDPSFAQLLLLLPLVPSGGDARRPTDPEEEENKATADRLVVGGARMDRCRLRLPKSRENCILKSLTSCGLWRVMKSRPPTNLLLLERDLQL
jgi:hypothetical protein